METKEEIQTQIDELRKKLERINKENEEEERRQSLKEREYESHTACEEGTSCAEGTTLLWESGHSKTCRRAFLMPLYAAIDTMYLLSKQHPPKLNVLEPLQSKTVRFLQVPNEETGINTDEETNEQEIITLHKIGVQSWCPQNFNKREGISNDSGTMYEVKICCLIFLKLVRQDAKFFICSNLKEAGDFDDVVVRYSYNLHNFPMNETLFIQLKHSENKNKRTIGFFDFRPYFDMKKFFLSYCSVHAISDPDHPVFRSDPEDRTFIIYTNSDISGKELPLVKYSSIPHMLKELLLASDVSTLHLGEEDANIRRVLEHLKQTSFKHPSLEPYPDTTDTMWILNFTRHKSFDTLKKHIRENETFDVNSYMEFLSKTLICYNQMDISNLDASIKNELEHVLTISPEETGRAFRLLVESVKTWREKESYYLDENCPLWAEIVRNIHRFRFNSRRNELLSLGVRYKQEEVTRLQKELSQDCRVYSVECSGKLTTATTLKVLQVLEYTGESYVLVTSKQYVENEELVLKTWLNKWCPTLVIEITSNYMLDDDIIGNLYEAHAKCTSCLITIFPKHNDTFAKIFQNTVLPCKRVVDSLAFNQLDRESQNRITSKKFNFQGQPVSLTDIIKTEALEKSSQDVLFRLFFDIDLTIGRDISEFKMSNYIPRYLEIPHISKDILYQNNGDAIALETITPQISTTDFRNKGKEMGISSMRRKFISNVTESLQNVDAENYVVLEHSNERSHFETLVFCKENTNVHWIKECNCKTETPRDKGVKTDNIDEIGNKNRIGGFNNFIWKKSKGNISTVKRSLMKSGHCCFDERAFISQDLESPVLITGEPGIGKSCMLKNLAMLIKRKFPTKWVVFVDLPQHCDFINTLKTVSRKDVNYILETSLKLCDYDVDFWKETRSNFENCVILLDAYDEMSPHYAEKVKQVMKYLNTTSCFLYIATRRSTVADLENELSVISYNVKLLNQDEGTKYFKEIMMSTSPISQEEADLFTGQVAEKYSAAMISGDKFLMSNPLHIKLLAEIYFDIIEDNSNIFNIYQIYSTFLEKKVVQIYKKANSDINNPAIKYQLNFFIQQFNDYNKNISSEQIFPGVKFSTTGVVTVQNEISNMCQKVGLMDEIVDCNIKYIHRSFTDYFAALWLKENYKDHRSILIDVMCKREYDMIKKFYDMSLSENLPLHSAVLSRVEDRIESLLSRCVDVNSTDEMQRTPLHIAASYNHVKKAQMLLEKSASMRLRDALDWTPTDYAIHTYSWETLDLLLGTQDYEEKEKLEISKRIFQILKEHFKGHEKPNELVNEERYQVILIHRKLDALYICFYKGLIHLLEIISKCVHLNQVITPPKILGIENSLNVESSKSVEYIPLHVAVESDQLELVSHLIETYQCDVDILDYKGRTALFIACRRGNIDTVKYLLDHGADIHIKDHNGNNALHFACEYGHIHLIKYCIETGADINAEDNYKHSVLHHACNGGDLDIIKYCVQQGANINCLDEDGNTVLICACYFGHLDIVKFCLQKGLDINHLNVRGANGLMTACKAGHLHIVKYCIQNGANIHTINNEGLNLLFYACEEGNLDIIKYCVQQGANINCLDKNGNTVLMYACYLGYLDIMKFCLEKGLDINHLNKCGINGLMMACYNGHLKIVKYCIQHGANIHARNNEGLNLLFYACKEGNLDIIRYCVQQGANINCLDKDDNTVLMYACYLGHLDIVEFSLEKGLDINDVNENGVNGLMMVCHNGYLDIVKYCIQHGANIHARDNDGDNLLVYACLKGNLDTVRYCVEQGADIYAKNLSGSDILLIATEEGHFASFEYILNFNFERESLYKSFQIACSKQNLEFVKLLTKKCQDILCDSECLAALFNSAYEGFFDIVQYCVEEGVDVNATLDGSCSLLLAAVEGGHVDTVRYLVNNGASVNFIYADGYTALLVASEWGHLDIVKYLVAQGADVNHTSNKHETALMVSIESRYKNIVEYLLSPYSNIIHDLYSCVYALFSASRLQPDMTLICLRYMEHKKAITSNSILFAALATMGSYFDILYKYSCHYTSLSDKNRLSYECILYTFEKSYFYMISAYWNRYCIEQDRGSSLKGGKIVLRML